MATQEIEKQIDEMLAQHTDVGDVMNHKQVLHWITRNAWLPGMARHNEIDLDRLVRANCNWRFQWGIDFAQLMGEEPTDDDWKASYFDQANLFATRLGVLVPFPVDDKLRYEYSVFF